jgi:hypothetical protein
MDQPYDRVDPKNLEATEPLIWPGPIGARHALRSGSFPKHGISKGPDAQACKALQVRWTTGMAGALDLVEVAITYAVDGTLDTTPDFRRHEVVVPKHVSEPFRHGGVLPPGLCFRWLLYHSPRHR